MCGWCLAYCTGVVLNTVRESAMPESKENKQADAGSRRFRKHFLCGALLCNFFSTEHEGLSTHVQREWSADPFMPGILSLTVLPGCNFWKTCIRREGSLRNEKKVVPCYYPWAAAAVVYPELLDSRTDRRATETSQVRG